MKVKNPKKLTTIAASVGAGLLVVLVALCATDGWRTRWSLKHECGAGMDCACFSNVIDNRLSKEQIRAFHEFLGAVKKRPTASILEFIDEASARGISESIAICRPAPVQQAQQNQQKTKGKN